jgi:acyl carrier protein
MNEDHTKIINFIYSEFGLSDVVSNTSLFSSKKLDSLNALSIILYIENAFEIKIDPFSVGIEDFDTVDRIVKLINDSR